ncbi:MAG: HupE/UreJ family protein [Chloroherpetonaceae bacterium]|nr:HupE/UreJ family protein [Chloroherpetonaceae bacterium]
MTSQFEIFLRLGFEHISDVKGYDHILFIVALTAGFPTKAWKKLLYLVTAFTVGHSITLALSTLQILTVSRDWIEFLIPLTIFVTAVYQVFITSQLPLQAIPDAMQVASETKLLYPTTVFFGLIHGLGFSNFLRQLLGQEENLFLPLFSFNLGLELGQIVIVGFAFLMIWFLTKVIKLQFRDTILVLMSGISFLAFGMMFERFPH